MKTLLPDLAPRTGLKWLAALSAANVLPFALLLGEYSGVVLWLIITMMILSLATAAALWRLATAATPSRSVAIAAVVLLVVRLLIGCVTAVSDFHAGAFATVFGILLGALGIVYTIQCVQRLTPRPQPA